jgi:hypothetical protein
MQGGAGQRGTRAPDHDLDSLVSSGVFAATVHDDDLDDLSALVAMAPAPAVSQPLLSSLQCKRCHESFETTWTLAHHQKRCRLVMRKRAETRMRSQGVSLAVIVLLRPHLRVPYTPCDFVGPRYYVGGAEALRDRRPPDVRATVCCAAELGALVDRSIPTLFCAARDNLEEQIVGNFAASVVEFVRKHSEGRVLFVCAAGQSRSVALLGAVLMLHEGMTLLEALGSIKAAREVAYPNIAFAKQLIQLELVCRGTNSVPLAAVEALHSEMV